MKLCTDCKWFDSYLCKAPQNMVVNPINGSAVAREYVTCNSHRTGAFTSRIGSVIYRLCGAHGRWFVAKENK